MQYFAFASATLCIAECKAIKTEGAITKYGTSSTLYIKPQTSRLSPDPSVAKSGRCGSSPPYGKVREAEHNRLDAKAAT